jgi:hypothetical protein
LQIYFFLSPFCSSASVPHSNPPFLQGLHFSAWRNSVVIGTGCPPALPIPSPIPSA